MNQPKEQVEVPEAAVEILAAREASCGEEGWEKLQRDAPGLCESYRKIARAVLTAALPAIKQAVEERVRERLESGVIEQLERLAVECGTAAAQAETPYGVEYQAGRKDGLRDAAQLLGDALSQPHNAEEEK